MGDLMRRDPCARPTYGERLHSRELGGFVVSETRYRANTRVAEHSHELAALAFVLEGRYTKTLHRARHDCTPGALVIEPPGARHADIFGQGGARCLLVEILPWRFDRIRACSPMLQSPSLSRDSTITLAAQRLRHELWQTDLASSLALEGLLLELTAATSRALVREVVPPRWMERVTNRLREDFRSPFAVSDLAAEAGVHPSYLASAFRACQGCSIGDFVRRLRVSWAAEQLAMTEKPIAAVADEAGFCDQSHFTRVFRRHIGMSPAIYRTRAHAH